MPPVYSYPKAVQIEKIETILAPRRTAESPLFDIMPLESARPGTQILMWDQDDPYFGMQQWRGINNAPATVQRVGTKRYMSEAGSYGDKLVLREDELTFRRSEAAIRGSDAPIDVSDLVAKAQEQLIHRRITRIETIISSLLFTGAFTVSNIDGTTVFGGSYTMQQQTPTTAWSDLANSDPYADMLNYTLLEDGQDVSFRNGGNNFQLMNQITCNYILKNKNPNSLFGRRVGGGNTINSLENVNSFLVDNDIPPIRVYNKGYLNASKTFTKYVPNGKVLVVGHRDSGVRVGSYRFTMNMIGLKGETAPYTFVKVVDNVPPTVEVHDGHNGGPTLQYPGSLILVNAA